MNKGFIFDIERFSTKDGPGIRTVVFFKGCNMRCYWCHNPEGIIGKPQLRFNSQKCTGCGECLLHCPSNAHKIQDGVHLIDGKCCNSCFTCVKHCYSGALTSVGRWMSLDEVYSEIEEDVIFYKRSNGGVTLSGGEVMQQSAFAYGLLKLCKDNNIHTAIETNLSFPWEKYEEILPYIDLIMGDIKHMDNDKHISGTGINNENVLNNLKKLKKWKIPIIIRTPVIPGFNANVDNIRRTGQFLKDLPNLQYYELLSYNPLGESKGTIINNELFQAKIDIPKREHMNELARVAKESGIKVYIDGLLVDYDK